MDCSTLTEEGCVLLAVGGQTGVEGSAAGGFGARTIRMIDDIDPPTTGALHRRRFYPHNESVDSVDLINILCTCKHTRSLS